MHRRAREADQHGGGGAARLREPAAGDPDAGCATLAPPARVSPELRRVLYLRPLGGHSTFGGSVTHALGVVRALGELGVAVACATTDRRIVEAGNGGSPNADGWHIAAAPAAFNAVPASYAVAGDLALVRAALPAARSADAIYQRHARFSLVGPILARLTGRPLFLEYNRPGNFLAQDPPLFAARRRRSERAALARSSWSPPTGAICS